jgi:hypothetical protein
MTEDEEIQVFFEQHRGNHPTEPNPEEKLELPAPRLQLRWELLPDYEDEDDHYCRKICCYELVLPTGEHDCRANDPETGCPGFRKELRISIDATVVSGGPPEPLVHYDDSGDKVLETPFRDSAHINWDGAALQLPTYVIYGGRFHKIKPPRPVYGQYEGEFGNLAHSGEEEPSAEGT